MVARGSTKSTWTPAAQCCAYLAESLYCLATIPSPSSWKFILIVQAGQPTCDSACVAAVACTWEKPINRYK